MSFKKFEMKKQFQKEKSLPNVIPAGVGTTCVVRLKKIAGQLYQDCDVYIGPKMSNSHWNFEESIWVNKYHYYSEDREENLKKYEKHIRNNYTLKKLLPSLKGKRLGCFCENVNFCHGSVLVKMVEEISAANYLKIKTCCSSRDKTPLSVAFGK